MKRTVVFLLLTIFINQVNANEFQFSSGNEIVSLIITKNKLSYSEGTFRKNIRLNPCKLKYANALNSQLLRLLAENSEDMTNTSDITVDGKKRIYSKNGKLSKILANLKPRIVALELVIDTNCS